MSGGLGAIWVVADICDVELKTKMFGVIARRYIS